MFKHTLFAITVGLPIEKKKYRRKQKKSTHTKTFRRKSSIDRSKGQKKKI